MRFSKIYDIRGTKVGNNLLFATALNLFDISSFEWGLIFALFHCHSDVRKQAKVLTAYHEDNRKCNELPKNI